MWNLLHAMDDFDKLSLLNENVKDEAVVSVIEPKKPEPVPPAKAPTIFTVFFANFKQDRELLSPAKGVALPCLRNTISAFVTLVFLSAVMVALWYFVDAIVYIPLALVFLSVSVPCLTTIFYYEFAESHTIKLSRLCFLIIAGALCYIMLGQLTTNVLDLFFYETLVDSIIMPAISNVVLFVVIYFAASFFKAESVRDYFMVVAFLISGYVICRGFVNGFTSLFLVTQSDNGSLFRLNAIVASEDMLKMSMQSLLDNLFHNYILTPILYTAWGVVYAYLVYYLIGSKKHSGGIPKSMYLLLLLIVVLDIMSEIDTSLEVFDIVLRVVSLVISLYMLVKMLNFSIRDKFVRQGKSNF